MRSSTWVLRRADLDRRIDEAGRTNDLLDEDAAGLLHLPGAGRRRDVHRLRPHGVPFLEAQRPVVDAGGQAEAVFGERRLATKVAAKHAADLRHGDVAFVDEDERIVGQIFEQGRRRLAGLAAGEIARIILDAGAGAGRLHHLEIEHACAARGAALRAGGPRVELLEPLLQILLDAADRLLQRRASASHNANWRRS